MKPFKIITIILMFTLTPTFTVIIIASESEQSWLIIPGIKIGPITSSSSESDLIKIYGKQNITNEQIYLYNEGTETEIGTVIFSKYPMKKIKILWKDAKKKKFIKRVELFGDRSYWKVAGGVTLGTSLKELERINGKAFTLWGLGWDAGGYIKSWQGGNLEKAFSGIVNVRLDKIYSSNTQGKLIPDNISTEEYNMILGEKILSSDDKIIQKINPSVREIFINFK